MCGWSTRSRLGTARASPVRLPFVNRSFQLTSLAPGLRGVHIRRVLGFYLFAAVVGVGLLAFSLGDDSHGGGHDASHAGLPHAHAGDAFLGFFKPRNVIFFLAAFGLTGSLLTWTGRSAALAGVAALVMGLLMMTVTHVTFRWLAKTESGANVVGDYALEGTVARVTVTVTPDSRGRVACSIGGREVHVIARLAAGVSGSIDAGREALVVRMVDGEAEVSPYGGTELLNS